MKKSMIILFALAVSAVSAPAATAPLQSLKRTSPVVTNEEDSAALAAIGSLSIPQHPEDIGAAPASLTGTVSRLFGYLVGSNVWFSVTNYMRTATNVVPKLSLHELRDGVGFTVWDQEEGLLDLWMQTTNHVASAIAGAMADVPDRAWGLYTSGLGAEAPSNTTWISTPTTVIAGGLEYVKIVTTRGSYWVLAENGMSANLDPTTNGFMTVKDDDGKSMMTFRKSSSYTVGALIAGITEETVDGVIQITLPFKVTSASHPDLYFSQSLTSQDWVNVTNSASGWTSQWSGQSGSWTNTLWPTSVQFPTGFFKSNVVVPGSSEIQMSVPLNVSSGILCEDGIHRVVPVYTNNAVTWEVLP